MGILTGITDLFGSSEETYRYECTNCGTEFESPHADMSKLSCPECSATRVRSTTMADV